VGSVAEDIHWLHELIAKQKCIEMVNQEIMPDHVHLFVNAHPIGDATKDVIERYVAMQKVK